MNEVRRSISGDKILGVRGDTIPWESFSWDIPPAIEAEQRNAYLTGSFSTMPLEPPGTQSLGIESHEEGHLV